MSGNIYIPKPCHENWNNMSIEEKGRHCSVCSKVVKDFTNMEKKEIIDVLKETTGEVCGRVSAKEITPTSKQKIVTQLNGWFLKRAIYPIMALLGFSLVNKKANAQVIPHKMGKIAYNNNYHTNNKKMTVVVKHSGGNMPVTNAIVQVVGGIQKPLESKTTNALGKVVFELDANNINGESIEVEVSAFGYETKVVTIQLIKDVQTVEINMEMEIIIMGEMMYIPDENPPKDNIVEQPDTNKKVEVIKCNVSEVITLPLINAIEIENIEFSNDTVTEDVFSEIKNDEPLSNVQAPVSMFNVYPVPANDIINVTTDLENKFTLDLFDENGKKILSVANGSERYQMNVADYAAGMYYLLIYVNGKAVETKKIIVTH